MTRKPQKPNVSVRLPDDLQEYLTRKASEGYRTLTGEITMRLEESRRFDESQDPSARTRSPHEQTL